MVEIETKVQRYERYIDSGVEWLGEVPKHWDLTRLGTRFKERKTKVSDKDFPPLSVTKNGTVPQLANAAKSNDGDNRKLVKKGDFAINSRSDRKGSSGIAYQDGSVSLIYIVMEPLNIQPIYCNYLLKSYNFIEEFYRMGHGIVADLWTTRYDEMKVIMVGIPPLSEQTAIAQFLDDKTTKIDEAITIKQQQISLLKERKQILIHKAVTRGLDKNVKLKDSGVQWIGKIPEHWELSRLKNHMNMITGFPFKSEKYTEEGIKLARGINVKEGVLNWKDTRCWPKVEEHLVSYLLADGDVLIAMDGSKVGKNFCQIKESDLPILLLQRVARLRPKKLLTSNFLYNHIVNRNFLQWVEMTKTDPMVPHIAPADIKNFQITIPPLSEQKEVSAYIESASQKIETAISLKQQEIAKLKEYKSSLINGVVTGKVKVC